MKGKIFTPEITKKISDLSNLEIDDHEKSYFTQQLNKSLAIIEKLKQLPTTETSETSQVTGLTNVFRDDLVDKKRILTQNQALSCSRQSYQGYFVVKAIFNEQ